MKNRLRILLVSPRGDFLCRNEEFSAYMKNSQEMRTILHYWNGIGAGLPTVAALTPGEHSIRICDENYQQLSWETPYDIVGITAMTQQAHRAYEIAAEARAGGAHTVMGGIHATVLPEEALRHVDTVVVGEAENTWPVFIRDFTRNRPRRRYCQADYAAPEMQEIPTPRYDLLEQYGYPVVWIQTTRGCPRDCEFCAASRLYGRTYRHKEVEQVLEEVRRVKQQWRFAQIGFADDNMFVDRRFSMHLLSAFRDLRFTWYAQSDISVSRDAALLRSLYESGCRILFVGFESVDPANLRAVNRDGWKARMSEHYEKYIRIIQENGIGVFGSFILGLDADTKQTPAELIDFINRNRLMGAQITLLTPFPGSRLRDRLQEENRILSSDWRWYTAWNAVIEHPEFSPESLERSMADIYRGIYTEEAFADRARYFKEICRRLVERNPVRTALSSVSV